MNLLPLSAPSLRRHWSDGNAGMVIYMSSNVFDFCELIFEYREVSAKN